MAQGIGYKDADGSYGFRLTEDGKVILGNTSDDLIQVTGTLNVNGNLTVSSNVYDSSISVYQENFEGLSDGSTADPSTNGTWTNGLGDGANHAGSGSPSNNAGTSIEHGLAWVAEDTDANSSGTGPDNAHSGSIYVFTEASGRNNKYYTLQRSFTAAESSTFTKMSFYYHMYGANMGNLYVYGSTDGDSWTQLDITKDASGTPSTANVISGQQHTAENEDYKRAEVDLKSYSGSALYIRIVGLTGNDYPSDIAIDAIEFIPEATFVISPTNVSASVPVSASAFIGDGSSLTGIPADALASDCVIPAKIDTSVAGDGITGGGGSALAVGAGTGVTVNANDVAIGQAVGTGNTPTFAGLVTSGDVIIGDTSTTSNERVKIVGGTDSNINLLVMGADDTTEYLGMGILSGVPTVTAGYVNTGDAPLAFATEDNGTIAEKMRITKDGKVGIGTSTPYANLSIAGDHDGGIVSLRLGADTGSGQDYTSRLEFSEDTNGSQVMQWGAFLEFDGDAVSPDMGMFKIGVRDDSITDTNVIKISRKAEANSLVLGDTDVTVAAPAGSVSISGSTSAVNIHVASSAITLNAPGDDINLKGNVHIPSAHTLQVDATAGFTSNVGVGLVTPSYGQLEVYKNSSTSPANITIHQDHSSGDSRLHLRSHVNDWYIINDGSDDDMVFINESTERMRLTNNGSLTVQSITCNGIFAQDSGAASFDHSLSVAGPFTVSNGSSPVGHLTHTNTTDGTTKTILKLQHNQEDSTADFDSGERFIEFYDSDSMLGYIHSEVSYSTFTGAHVSQQKAGQDYSGWKKGMILSSTGEVISSGDMSRNWIQVGLSQQQKDPKVAGVFTDFMTEHELKDFDPTVPAINYNALGEGKILVTNINGNIENGDYITTCEIPGYGMKQDDDLLHNYTVAKITQDCLFDLNSTTYECEEIQHNGQTYRVAFVGCTYHCG